MATMPSLYTYQNNATLKSEGSPMMDPLIAQNKLHLKFLDTHWDTSGVPNSFNLVPNSIILSYPLYFGIWNQDDANSLSNPSFKINANLFGANQKIGIYGSTQYTYTSFPGPTFTGDPLFSTTSIVNYFIVPGSGGIYNFPGTAVSTYASGNLWTCLIRMQLKIDNTANNADVFTTTPSYTVTYTWTET